MTRPGVIIGPTARIAAFRPRDIVVAIGRELTLARLDLNWSRKRAVHRVPGMTVRSLENYECAFRLCHLVALVRLCQSMSVPAPDLLELAMQRTPVDLDTITLHVDLPAVALDRWPPKSLRRWANQLWHRGAHDCGVVRVPPRTLAQLAQATKIQQSLLLTYLASRGPQSIRGSKTLALRIEPNPDPPTTIGLTKESFNQALGVELRILRTNRNWTAADVTSHLPGLVLPRSWYGYEYGTVNCSTVRLIELGRLFATPAPVLLGRTLRRLGLDAPDAACLTGAHHGRAPSLAHSEVEQ